MRMLEGIDITKELVNSLNESVIDLDAEASMLYNSITDMDVENGVDMEEDPNYIQDNYEEYLDDKIESRYPELTAEEKYDLKNKVIRKLIDNRYIVQTKINEADENKIETTEVTEEQKNSIDFLKSVMENMINASGTSDLEKEVLEDQLDEVDGYDTPADFIEHLTDLGITGGGVASLIYYDDTLAFCEKYEEEINQMLADGINEFGSLKDMFGDNYDDSDPMNLGTSNRNLFAWYAYEETARNIAFALNEALDLNLNL